MELFLKIVYVFDIFKILERYNYYYFSLFDYLCELLYVFFRLVYSLVN